MSFLYLICIFIPILLSNVAEATVPSSAQFNVVNEGDFTYMYYGEYDSNCRFVNEVSNNDFLLCFYNSTPYAYTLGLMMGIRSDSRPYWVWEANRGRPVGEKAVLSFGKDGNLVLKDANGKIAWQTDTANKGVVGIKVLSNGNIVLHNSKGKFIWQSFDYATDSLLVGQSLKLGRSTKLVSRASDKLNSNGPYSLVMESNSLAMYYTSPKSPKPFNYFDSSEPWFQTRSRLDYVKLKCETYDDSFYELILEHRGTTPTDGVDVVLARMNYDCNMTLLRLGMDGNLRLMSYNYKMRESAWETTYTLFSRDSESECQLPERCGHFGLCEDNQCVACPTKDGLMGWSKQCQPQKPPSCGSRNIPYYKVQGVDHFMCKYTRGDGPMKEVDCWRKCTVDCKCLGYFYHTDTSRCWIAYDLKTLTRVANSTHLAYIKVAK